MIRILCIIGIRSVSVWLERTLDNGVSLPLLVKGFQLDDIGDALVYTVEQFESSFFKVELRRLKL